MKVSETIVWRAVNALKPDPDQPRKSFDEDKLNVMSESVSKKGIVVPLDIDINDVIIMGEYRWRSAKKAEIKNVPCRVIYDITPRERLERQLIENLHHHELKSVELEEAIKRLWDTNEYKSTEELSLCLGYKSKIPVVKSLAAQEVRESMIPSISDTLPTQTLYEVSKLPKGTQKQIVERVAAGDIKPTEIKEVATSLKNVPEKEQRKVLKKDDQSILKKAQIAKEVTELPKEVQKEVLNEKAPISLEKAKEIAKLPEKKQREQAIKITKEEMKKPESKETTVEKKTESEEKPNEGIVKIYEEIYDKVSLNCKKKMIHTYDKPTQKKATEIAIKMLRLLKDEFEPEKKGRDDEPMNRLNARR